MKPLMWAIATIFIAVINLQSVRAQSFELQFPITCGDTKTFIGNLKKEFDEEIFFLHEDVNENNEQLYHSLWVNHQTQSWTFVVTNDVRGVTCLLASGKNFTIKLHANGI